MHAIGTAGVVVQVTGTNWPRPAYTLLVTGLCRFKVNRLLQEEPYPVAQVEQLDKLPGDVAGKPDTQPENVAVAAIIIIIHIAIFFMAIIAFISSL